MTSKPTGTWGQWAANAALMSLIRLLGLFPFSWRSAFGGKLVSGFGGRLAGYRKRAERHLGYIYPDMDAAQKKRITWEVLDNAGRTFFENFYPLDFQKTHPDIELWGDGLDELLAAHTQGRSIVLVSGHFGNHEALRQALSRHDIKVGGMYRPMGNPYLNRFYLKVIEIGGKSGPLLPANRAGTKGFRKHLKEGHATLVLLLDLSVARGEEMDFLGKPAMTSTAAAAFALEADALYIPYFSIRNADRTSFSVEIAKSIPASDAATMTAQGTREIEARIAKNPGNWFWVHRRWKPWI